MSSVFNATAESFACGNGARQLLITYLYSIGSLVYIVADANLGILTPVVVNQIEFIKNVKLAYPVTNSYYILYNNQYYQDELTTQAVAQQLALAYWEEQEELLLKQLHCS